MVSDDTLDTSPQREENDLKIINGIGPTWSDALRKIGIRSFSDLLRHTPETLSNALEEKAGISIPAGRIEAENWIGQARALAEATEPAPSKTVEHRQHAGFSLFFDVSIAEQGARRWQTRVYHDETGDLVTFSGVDPAQWESWIVNRAEFPEDVQAAETATVEPAAPEPTSVTIVDVDVTEATPFAMSNEMEKRLKVDVDFTIEGPLVDTLTGNRTPYQVEVYVADMRGGDWELVVFDRGRLMPYVFDYSTEQEFPIPEVGQYSVCSTVVLVSPEEIMGFLEGPTFTVVE